MEEKRNGQVFVSSQYTKLGKAVGEESKEESMIYVDTFATTPAEVETKLGLTINLGNYESLRVDSGVRIPCYKEEVPEAQEFAFKLAEKLLFDKVREVKGTL